MTSAISLLSRALCLAAGRCRDGSPRRPRRAAVATKCHYTCPDRVRDSRAGCGVGRNEIHKKARGSLLISNCSGHLPRRVRGKLFWPVAGGYLRKPASGERPLRRIEFGRGRGVACGLRAFDFEDSLSFGIATPLLSLRGLPRSRTIAARAGVESPCRTGDFRAPDAESSANPVKTSLCVDLKSKVPNRTPLREAWHLGAIGLASFGTLRLGGRAETRRRELFVLRNSAATLRARSGAPYSQTNSFETAAWTFSEQHANCYQAWQTLGKSRKATAARNNMQKAKRTSTGSCGTEAVSLSPAATARLAPETRPLSPNSRRLVNSSARSFPKRL